MKFPLTPDFIDSIKKTSVFVAKDQGRPVLSGVLFKFEKKKLVLVATDGFVLTEIKTDIDVELTKGQKPFIIAGKDLQLIIKNVVLHKRVSELGTVELKGGLLEVSVGLPKLVMKFLPVEGNYPEYQGLIDRHKQENKKPHKFGLDINLIGRITKGFVWHNTRVIVNPKNNLSAIFIEPETVNREQLVVIMPLRMTDDEVKK